jgi:hypothetical protein
MEILACLQAHLIQYIATCISCIAKTDPFKRAV